MKAAFSLGLPNQPDAPQMREFWHKLSGVLRPETTFVFRYSNETSPDFAKDSLMKFSLNSHFVRGRQFLQIDGSGHTTAAHRNAGVRVVRKAMDSSIDMRTTHGN